MKKLLLASLATLFATTVLAHPPQLSYLEISSLITISPFITSTAEADSKVEEVRAEAATILSQVEMNQEVAISQELSVIIENIRESHKELNEATNLEILEIIVTQ